MSTRRQYTLALCRELEKEAERVKGRAVDTVFFGGGTPSLLSCADISLLLDTLAKHYCVKKDAEISMEINPATADVQKLSCIKSAGVNRLSIGMQSAHDCELAALGRIHTHKDFLCTYENARRVGFDNINADVMYGIPNQTCESFHETLKALVSLDCDHVSAYALKIEEGTPFYRDRHTLVLPTEDQEYEMYLDCIKTLACAGFEHYEISNYAKKDKKCRHNLRYWRAGEYLGFGVAAYSYFDGVRYGNGSDVDDYIKNGAHIIDRDLVSDKESEYIMLRFRLREGVCREEFKKLFGVDFAEKYRDPIERMTHLGYMKINDGRYFLSDSGMYVSNSVLLEFI